MYTSFYRLSKMPFDITPDPDFLFPGDLHREAFASVLYGLTSHKGILTLIGEVGTGKTMTLRTLMKSAHLSTFRIIYLFNPNLSPREFIDKLLTELDLDFNPEHSLNVCIDILAEKTLDLYRQGSGLVIIIDEAQHVPDETLEFVRLLSNIEADNRKLVQVLLAGQPELLDKLQQPHMRQLRQRIVVSAKLKPMTPEQTGAYIVHRLRAAGADYLPFDARAFRKIVDNTRGNPRLVNIVCDLSLANGMGHMKKQVDVGIVNEVLLDLENTTLSGVFDSSVPVPRPYIIKKKDRRYRKNKPALKPLQPSPEAVAMPAAAESAATGDQNYKHDPQSPLPARQRKFMDWLRTNTAGQWVLGAGATVSAFYAAQQDKFL